MVPPDIRAEMDGLNNYAAATGRCIMCEMISQELLEQNRIIWENNDFIHIAPFASRFPYETWIIPRNHQPDFAMMGESQVKSLAAIIRPALKKMDSALCGPPYNMVVHTCPVNTEEDVAHYHWHVEILPRLTKMAGFELGTGFYINPTPPELAAEILKETEIVHDQLFTHNTGEVARYV
jgi:UDPglucose--hexose-1-phosphate uridylyltransferase